MTCCNHNCRQGRDCPRRRARDPREVFTEAARSLRTWLLRFAISFLMLTGFLPAPLLLEWLRWLRESMHPQHPGMPVVLQEIAETEDRCRA